MSETPPPNADPPDPKHEEILTLLRKVDNTVLEYQKTTSRTLQRVEPLLRMVDETLREVKGEVESFRHEIEAVKRRIIVLEKHNGLPIGE
jgi:CRISPR/Cas system CSM-associated protein Csm2 small subunit